MNDETTAIADNTPASIPEAALKNLDLRFYWVDVHNPETSALEILDALSVRDRLEQQRPTMTNQELQALIAADLMLLEHGEAFHQTIKALLDIEEERKAMGVTPERWWWHVEWLRALNGAFSTHITLGNSTFALGLDQEDFLLRQMLESIWNHNPALFRTHLEQTGTPSEVIQEAFGY